MDQIREDQSSLPKKHRYKIGDILKEIELPKATYHNERKRIANYHDKYAKVKKVSLQIAKHGQVRGRWTYGYRRVSQKLQAMGIHLADMTINKLMAELGVQVTLFNRHRNGKSSSYKGKVGKIANNLLKQQFNATIPYQLLHTDASQVCLANHN
ncbi:transposase [Lactobacillaceae bacterium 24-114]